MPNYLRFIVHSTSLLAVCLFTAPVHAQNYYQNHYHNHNYQPQQFYSNQNYGGLRNGSGFNGGYGGNYGNFNAQYGYGAGSYTYGYGTPFSGGQRFIPGQLFQGNTYRNSMSPYIYHYGPRGR
jgi:hypothetical protein